MSTAAELKRLMEQAYELRSALDPRDIPDAQYLMSKTTHEQLREHLLLTVSPPPPDGVWWPMMQDNTLLTIPVREDASVPDGEIKLVAENAIDRALRRAAASGVIVNTARMTFPPAPPPPPPTLRALLRHWWRRVRHGG